MRRRLTENNNVIFRCNSLILNSTHFSIPVPGRHDNCSQVLIKAFCSSYKAWDRHSFHFSQFDIVENETATMKGYMILAFLVVVCCATVSNILRTKNSINFVAQL